MRTLLTVIALVYIFLGCASVKQYHVECAAEDMIKNHCRNPKFIYNK